jgi:hypothetical protein
MQDGRTEDAAGVELRKYLADVSWLIAGLLCRRHVAVFGSESKSFTGRWENDTFGECESFVR